MAIIANEGGLPAGTQLDNGLALLDTIPEAHKVALSAIAKGAPIFRYGVVIGYAEVADRKRQLGARGSHEFARAPAAR